MLQMDSLSLKTFMVLHSDVYSKGDRSSCMKD